MSKSQLIGGYHGVRTVLREGADAVSEIWLEAKRNDRRVREILELAGPAGVPVRRLDKAELEQLASGVRHQGFLARAQMPAARDEGFLKNLLERLAEPPLLLMLDGIQDPHNLGACLRTADAAGAHGVIAPQDRAVGLTATVCKVASGAASTQPYIQVTNLARTLRWLQDTHNIWLIGTAGEATQTLYQTDLTGPVALVMGAEEKGLRRLTREVCDQLVSLPMAGSVESLNVSVAAGVCLFEAVRQRSGEAQSNTK